MALTLLAGVCGDGIDCPRVYRTADGVLLVQGYVVDETHVRVPAALLVHAERNGAQLPAAAPPTGDVVVAGRAITAQDLLDELAMPPGEHAVVPEAWAAVTC